MKRVSIFLVAVALVVGMTGCGPILPPSQNLEIWDWYDLDAIRDNLSGNYTLMNDLDSTTAGYEELASETANGGKGWEPIGTDTEPFTGTFDGQGYEIRDLFINRPDEHYIGLFGHVGDTAVIKNVGVVNATVTGNERVGGLVGASSGTVSNCYAIGSTPAGEWYVGGLVGLNEGTVSNSYATGNVTGNEKHVGGLVGSSYGTVSNSYSTGNVTGDVYVGGLVGFNWRGTVSNSYSTGNVTGNYVGGLVGLNGGTVSNSYSTGNVPGLGPGGYAGGLVGLNDGTVSNSFWDTETSGQDTSDGGTGKNTTEMQYITTFSGAGWNITTVSGIGERNPSYIWNIVDDVTYPFLSWQS